MPTAPNPIPPRARIAILGSGVSGIAALWALNEYSEHEVNVYEAGSYVGGHTHTVEFEREFAEGWGRGREGRERGWGADKVDFVFYWDWGWVTDRLVVYLYESLGISDDGYLGIATSSLDPSFFLSLSSLSNAEISSDEHRYSSYLKPTFILPRIIHLRSTF